MWRDCRYIESAHVRFHKALHLRAREIVNHRFLLVESGQGEFRFPDASLKIDARTLLLLSPGSREIRYAPGLPVSYLYVEFYVPQPLITGPFLEIPQRSPHCQTLEHLLWSIERESGRCIEPLIPAAVELALFDSKQANTKVDQRIQTTLEYIDRHLTQPLRISALARVAGLSLPQFRRLFQKAVGCSPKEYVLKERMQYARKILQTEGLRVGEVADLMNFETVYQFSNQYKKIHGNSPLKDLLDS